MTPTKSEVAETLDEHRGQLAYNLPDGGTRRFAAAVPQVKQWDDHEVLNNWYAGEILDVPATRGSASMCSPTMRGRGWRSSAGPVPFDRRRSRS